MTQRQAAMLLGTLPETISVVDGGVECLPRDPIRGHQRLPEGRTVHTCEVTGA